MACPQVANEGDGLWIWKVAANILNKELCTANKGRPFSLEAGMRLLTVEISMLGNITKDLGVGPGWILWKTT
jgi:hypothetical protein